MMLKKGITTEELLSDESFIEYVKFGRDKTKWASLSADPQHREVIDEARRIIEALRIREDLPSRLTTERIRRKIDARIKPAPAYLLGNTNDGTKRMGSRWMRYAAAVIAVVVISSISYVYVSHKKSAYGAGELPNIQITKATSAGQKMTVFLPDGSRVKLNSNSTISYPEHFSESQRAVTMEGEAFFEVVKDVNKPFVVRSGDVVTSVLGTSFNVRSYEQEKTTNIILATGKVKVSSKKGDGWQSVLLEPGMQVEYNRQEKSMLTAKADPQKDLLWKDGIILFDRASRKEVFEKLENWYGVTFDLAAFSGEKDDWTYSARFDNKSLENVLLGISYVKKFSFDIENNKVIIHKN